MFPTVTPFTPVKMSPRQTHTKMFPSQTHAKNVPYYHTYSLLSKIFLIIIPLTPVKVFPM